MGWWRNDSKVDAAMTSLPFPLSLQRVTRAEPRVFNNTERLQFHRQFAPVTFANTDFPRNPARTSSPSAIPGSGRVPSFCKDLK